MPTRLLIGVVVVAAAATAGAALATSEYQATAGLTYRTSDLDPETVRLLGIRPAPAVGVATGLVDSVLTDAPQARVLAARAAADRSGVRVADVLAGTTVRSADPLAGRTAELRTGPRALVVVARGRSRDTSVRWANAFATELVAVRRTLVDQAVARARQRLELELARTSDRTRAAGLRDRLRQVETLGSIEAGNLAFVRPAKAAESASPGPVRLAVVAALAAAWAVGGLWWLVRFRRGRRR